MKKYNFRIRKHLNKYFPEYLNENNIWQNIENNKFYSKTYDESYYKILVFKWHNNIQINSIV